ncbi:hypothetical protein PENFLA_c019G03579 [Penicillium flavigenum]|uniref:Uncharacterized protein n=1 Tax=Penicillium flavigenum TaxID=254877 RepID=A0A1V6SZB5_9EURO|nr:hypothetical protein PENFLA_c019G03579 [Penicillium flavigenum]
MPIDQVCGQGYLDNLRGRCGTITDWGCMFVDENVNKVEEKEKNEDQITGAKMTFLTQAFCSASDIIEAIGAASAADGRKSSNCGKILRSATSTTSPRVSIKQRPSDILSQVTAQTRTKSTIPGFAVFFVQMDDVGHVKCYRAETFLDPSAVFQRTAEKSS